MPMNLQAVRTPDERFENLPGWPYEPRYLTRLPGFGDLRVHCVDVNAAGSSGRTMLCLHGQPTWSYLYRRMIPVFTQAGHRTIAPDLFGFGRSDKPVDDAFYSFSTHRDMLLRVFEQLDLQRVTLVVQDWGGLLGLTLPMEFPDRIDRLLVMNTGLGVGRSPGPGFDAWKSYVAANPGFSVAGLLRRSCPHLGEAEAAAYAAPFPDDTYRAGVRRFPALVPVAPAMDGVEISRRAAHFLRHDWRGETFMAIGMQDPVLGPDTMFALAGTIRNCAAPLELADAGHFVQEWGGIVAASAMAHFGDTVSP